MKLDRYPLKTEENFTVFEFVSEGTRGAIKKIIQFQETTEPNLYNLAFGDKNNNTGKLDDLVVSNNGDSEKVLATVVAALYVFFNKHPDAFVYATGSTKSRTRLYRMGIAKFYDEMSEDFYVYGQIGDDYFKFEPEINYDGFLAQRKFN
jgi:hypothetical protein